MSDTSERVQIRARFWPRYFRWAVTLQLGWVLFLAIGMAVKGIQGDWQVPSEMVAAWGAVSGVLALVALVFTVRRRNFGCAEITSLGIRPFTLQLGWDIRFRWSDIETVRVKAGPFGNRWLEVVTDGAPPFKLTAHPTNPADVLDAFERFAGPDHPLTQAYATFNGEHV